MLYLIRLYQIASFKFELYINLVLLLIMIIIQYFANFAGDVAVTMLDISKMCTQPPNLFGL